jgi:hypothetical protein
MSSKTSARLVLAVAVSAVAVLGACQGDVPTAPPLRGAIMMAMGDTGGHEAPDPRVPPVCHGYTATIWWNMPANLIPRGVIIRPTVPGDHEELSAAEEEHEDEAPGYVIIGTNTGDVIAGSPKRDSIYGNNGNDVICADPPQHESEPGEDENHEGGSPGHGGGGPDKVWGGNGNDLIYGGGGPDSIYAGNDQDVVYGGGGPDYILGENGNDTLHGGPGPDLLNGGSGNDVLYGEESGDVLLGELGDDLLYGAGGFDTLDGGKGTNLLDPGDQSDDDDHEGGHTASALSPGS